MLLRRSSAKDNSSSSRSRTVPTSRDSSTGLCGNCGMTALSAASSNHFQVSSNLMHISIKKQQQQRQLQRIVWRDSIISSIKQLLAAAIIKCDSSKNSSSRICWDRKMSSISSVKQLSSNYQQHQAIISSGVTYFISASNNSSSPVASRDISRFCGTG